MSTYDKKTWVGGEPIRAEYLNAIEDQLESITPPATGAIRYDINQEDLTTEQRARARQNLDTIEVSDFSNGVEQFNTKKAYQAGEYCIHNNKLFRRLGGYEVAAESQFVPSHWELVKLADDVATHTAQIEQLTQTTETLQDLSELQSLYTTTIEQRVNTNRSSIEELQSHGNIRYDIAQSDLNDEQRAQARQNLDTIEISDLTAAEEYQGDKIYQAGDYCIRNNEVYQCTFTMVAADVTFRPEHWKLLRIADSLAAISMTLNDLMNTQNLLTSQLSEAEEKITALSQRNAIASADYDLETYKLYLYDEDNNEIIPGGIYIPGGGGSGGGSVSSAEMIMTSNTGWVSKTLAQDENGTCPVSFTWSSIENGISTGAGVLTIIVNKINKSSQNINQGNITIDIYPYLSSGNNSVELRVADQYGTMKLIRLNVNIISIGLTSTFSTSSPFTDEFIFTYIPSGAVNKLVHFVIDGEEIASVVTNANNIQQRQTIPMQEHGAHILEVWFTSVINNETVYSNRLYYEFISIAPENYTPIIASSFNATTVQQYTNIIIPYRVYEPSSPTTTVIFEVNGAEYMTIDDVDRTEHTFSYRANIAGEITIAIKSGIATPKTFTLTIEKSNVSVTAETTGLQLYLTPVGRSNGENINNRSQWTSYNTVATLSDFNWKLNGWMNDSDGIPILRVSENARVNIPFKLFNLPIIQDGFTFEIDFATREVSDYYEEIVKCWDSNVGLKITPQQVIFQGSSDVIDTIYKDNEHIRLSITVASQQDGTRLMLIYINGIMSRAIQYASIGPDFTQDNPQDISIGSNSCGIDIYGIRVYNYTLNRYQIVNNWIADSGIGSLLVDRYNRNNIYDNRENILIITPDTLASDLPYFILDAPELPQFKDDVKTITGSYTNKQLPSKSFTFTGCEIDVQGTSSAPYFRKNYDMKFKQGFKTASGNIDNYALRTNSIPFNRFVLKADVASSESANNTQLVMFYNDTCPYKTPAMEANSSVRWGIEGIPIALFWHDTNPDSTTFDNVMFMGKYNFNLPKRAPAPYGYGEDKTLESWEVERNNSANVKFQDDNFTATSIDEDGKQYPTWYDDFEARFPSDEYRDITKLKAFVSFIKSTDRNQATNAALNASETYDGVEYDSDTAAYRLAKFKALFPEYAELDSFVFYYLFTEMFTMIDSRAKNMFIGFNGGTSSKIGRKATAQPYDMDTAMGTNNSGRLMFGYSLEDTDTVSAVISGSTNNNAPVFNAQDSVLWNNIRDSYRTEIRQMYSRLRTGDVKWSYNILESRYENHQSHWPEALFNEDAWTKYIYPLVEAVTYDENNQPIKTNEYLPMLQGSKTEQRKWWLYNRFRYMDSKFTTGEAVTRQLSFRAFSSGSLTIIPAIDMYLGVQWGGGTGIEPRRAYANQPEVFSYFKDSSVQEMESYIQSGDLISSITGLSSLYPNELKFSNATRLRKLIIGSDEEGYSNGNLKEIDVHNSVLLEEINCRNCPALTGVIDLSGSPHLQKAYFGGTSIGGLDLVDGGVLQILELPDTTNTLMLLNQSELTTLYLNTFDNIRTLMLTNFNADCDIVVKTTTTDNQGQSTITESSSKFNIVTVLNSLKAQTRVNIQGFNLVMNSKEEISNFITNLNRLKGIIREKNANGDWIETLTDYAQVIGKIRLSSGSLNGDEIAQWNTNYPYITFDADAITSHLYYYNYNGTSLLYTEEVELDGTGSYTGEPARSSTAQYNYTFAGWSRTKDSTINDPSALTNIRSDRNVYAAYTTTIRSYQVAWKNANGVTLTDEHGNDYIRTVPYGTVITYPGDETNILHPSAPEDYAFKGWEPADNAPITGTTNKIAQYYSLLGVTAQYLEGTLTRFESENITKIAQYAFQGLQLSEIDIGDAARNDVITIENYNSSGLLRSLIIRNNTCATLSSQYALTMRDYQYDTARIFVPSNLVNTYKNASNWSAYADYILSIDKYPMADHELDTISDSWEAIAQAAQDGSYKTKYKLGDVKTIIGWNNQEVPMELVAFDTDILADGSGTAAMTWMAKYIRFTANYDNDHLKTLTGTEMQDQIYSSLPEILKTNIKLINKIQSTLNSSFSVPLYIWLPSRVEMGFSYTNADNQEVYYSYFNNNNSRIKRMAYMLRENYNSSPSYYIINTNGIAEMAFNFPRSATPCFCI